MKPETRAFLKKAWHFIWEDDSVLSWLVNIALAFVLIKFIVYPGLGFILQTTHPVVAVVSESMEHGMNRNLNSYMLCDKSFSQKERINYDGYWEACGKWYEDNFKITKEQFGEFSFKNGFNKGDIMVLKGAKPGNIEVGDVIVFTSKKPDPIIHRVVNKWEKKGEYYYHTKGDHNRVSIKDTLIDETNIHQSQVIGKAVFKVPFMGYIKIWFNQIICYNPVKQALSNFLVMPC